MTRRHNWYPLQIYDVLYRIAHENNISYHELAFMILREALLHYGFDCNHPITQVKKSPTDNTPYCYHCMARLEEIEDRVLEQVKGSKFGRFRTVKAYRAKETFIDKIRKERKENERADYEAKLKADTEAGIKAVIEEALRKDREKEQ